MNIIQQLESVKEASRDLSVLPDNRIKQVLVTLAQSIRQHIPTVVKANKKDLDQMSKHDPKYDRLLLTPQRIDDIANDVENVANLASPLGRTLSQKKLDNGLDIEKITVPLGVVGVIYEARPNVTVDVFTLCFKSGNACVLKGGSDALNSNIALVNIIKGVLAEMDLSREIIKLLPATHEAGNQLMNATGYVDVLIPRGSQNLIHTVRHNSKIPVIETGAGIVHTFFDKYGDIEKGQKIILNAKTRRVSVCNALDCLIVHKNRLSDLHRLVAPLAGKKVVIYADNESYSALKGNYQASLLSRATANSFGTEFLDYKMSIKTVAHFNDALEHINTFSSKHSEAIICEDHSRIDLFLQRVDAAAVYANTSTAFTDGAQLGLGAEIGISTQKLHARGPMALNELTSYKWVVRGDGQVRG